MNIDRLRRVVLDACKATTGQNPHRDALAALANLVRDHLVALDRAEKNPDYENKLAVEATVIALKRAVIQ